MRGPRLMRGWRTGRLKAVCTSRSESKAAKPSMDRGCRCQSAIALPPDIRRPFYEKVAKGLLPSICSIVCFHRSTIPAGTAPQTEENLHDLSRMYAQSAQLSKRQCRDGSGAMHAWRPSRIRGRCGKRMDYRTTTGFYARDRNTDIQCWPLLGGRWNT